MSLSTHVNLPYLSIESMDQAILFLDRERSESATDEHRERLTDAINGLANLRYQANTFTGVNEVDHAHDVGVKTGTVQVAPSGLQFDYVNPKKEMFRIGDVAHHLARIHRFGGGSDATVAQHSCVGVEYLHHPMLKRAFLLHDVEEFVMGDMASPLKRLVGGQYRAIATNIRMRAFERFHLPLAWAIELPAEVKKVDLMLLEWERRDLMPTADWVEKQPLPELSLYSKWSTYTAEQQFLRKFKELFPEEPDPFSPES